MNTEQIKQDREARDAMRRLLLNDDSMRRGVFLREDHVKMCKGDINAALMLSQIAFWFTPDRTGKPKTTIVEKGVHWLAKKRGEWQDECFLTVSQVRRAEEVLAGLGLITVRVSKFGGTPTTHYTLNAEAYTQAYDKAQEPMWASAETANGLVASSKSICRTQQVHLSPAANPLTETTTENTYIDYPPTNHSVVDTVEREAFWDAMADEITGNPEAVEFKKCLKCDKVSVDCHWCTEPRTEAVGVVGGSSSYTYCKDAKRLGYIEAHQGKDAPARGEFFSEQGYADYMEGFSKGLDEKALENQANTSTVGVVGGSLSNIGEERPASRTAAQTDEFYDGEASSEEEFLFGDNRFFDAGYRDALAGKRSKQDTLVKDSDHAEYTSGYEAGIRHLQRKVVQVNVTEENKGEGQVVVNTASISRAADMPPAASTSPVQPRKGTRSVETPPSPEIAAEMAKWDATTDGNVYAYCKATYAWDEAWIKSLDAYYSKAKTNPLRYVRDMCLRRIRQTLEVEAQGLKDEKPKAMLVFPEVRNRDPKRAEKIAAYEKVDPEAQARAEETGRILGERALAKARAKRAGGV